MAIEILDRQILEFDPETKCICGTEYCQPFLLSDSINLYGTITPLKPESILLDGPFATPVASGGSSDYWDLDGNWAISATQLIGADVAAGSQAVYLPPLGLRAGHAYAITVVCTITGTEDLGNGALITINGDNLIFPDLVNTGNYLPDGSGMNVSFSYTWLYIPSAVTSDDLIISKVNDISGSFVMGFSLFIIREVSTPAVALYNLNGTQIYNETAFAGANSLELLNDDGNVIFSNAHFQNASFLGADFESNNRYFPTIVYADLKWMFYMELSVAAFDDYTGCGKFRIYDRFNNEELVYNGGFTDDLLGWTAGDGWTWNAGKATFDSDFPVANSGTLTQTVYVGEWGGIYNFSFIASAFGGIGHEMKISYNAGAGVVLLQGNIGQAATYNYQIDTSEFTGTSIQFIFQKDSPLSIFSIDTVSFSLAHPDTFNESNCVSIQEENDCTLLFEGVNNDLAFTEDVDVLGYTFDDSGVTRSIRLHAKKKYAGYIEEKEVFRFSNNLRKTLYARTDKQWQVDIGDAAEHAHDLLDILRLMDSFFIDGVAYTPEGDYELRPRKTSDNSQAVFMVVKTQGISSNYSCS